MKSMVDSVALIFVVWALLLINGCSKLKLTVDGTVHTVGVELK